MEEVTFALRFEGRWRNQCTDLEAEKDWCTSTIERRLGGVAQVVDSLLSMCETLS